MVIGFDGSRAFNRQKTGTENYSYQLLLALSKIDTKNNYIVYLRSDNINRVTIVEQLIHFPGNFEFVRINWPRLWTQGGLAVQTFKDILDVLFIPAHTSPLIHKPGLKTVVTVHDLGAEYLPKMHQLRQQLYLKWITRYQLKSASKLIAVSHSTKNDLIKRVGIEGQKIKVVYEGFNQDLFQARSDTKSYSLKGYWLFVGTIQPRKNLERIIKAFKLVGKGNLVIAGSKGWQTDKIYKLPKKLGIAERVKFLGYVSDKEMVKLYKGAIALIFPSLFEGFGLPILEAQASGCPVLTSTTSSMPEVAGKGALLVDPYNVEEIANGMMKIMDKEIGARLVELGYNNIKRFSWEKAAKQTLKILESV